MTEMDVNDDDGLSTTIVRIHTLQPIKWNKSEVVECNLPDTSVAAADYNHHAS